MISTKAVAQVDGLLTKVLEHSGLELTYKVEQRTPEPSSPEVVVSFDGPDVRYLLARNAELLLAIEYIAAQALRLTSEQHDLISCDAGHFKAERDRMIERHAAMAVASVKATGRAYHFKPMNSRERRLLHLALAGSGMLSVSEGEGLDRHLVLHPGS